jgi:hypothetical protein
MGWMGYVARILKIRNAYRISVGNTAYVTNVHLLSEVC